MQKRGTHVDWAISMGIFILYVFFMIVFLRIGGTEIYDEKILFTIIEKGFYDETKYFIEKRPLYIYSDVSGEYYLRIENFPYDYDERNTAMLDFNLTDYLDFDLTTGNLDLRATLRTGENLFWLVYSSSLDYSSLHDDAPWTPECYCWTLKSKGATVSCSTTITIRCIKDKTSDPTYGDFNYGLGLSEELTGFLNKDKINAVALSNDVNDLATRCDTLNGYNALKEDWDFPKDKNFRIYYVEGTNIAYTEEDIVDICNQAQPGKEETVSVKEQRDWFLNENGKKEGAIINIGIW